MCLLMTGCGDAGELDLSGTQAEGGTGESTGETSAGESSEEGGETNGSSTTGDGDGDGDGDGEPTTGDGDGEPTTGDGDGDADCVPTAAWGSGFNVGEPVANWSLHGYFDGDADGAIDGATADFTLEDIYCAGYDSLAIFVVDQGGAFLGESYFGDLAAADLESEAAAAKGAMLMVYWEGSPETSLDYYSSYFELGYHVGSTLPIPLIFTPYPAVVDLTTGEVVDDSGNLTGQQILAYMQAISNG